MVEAWFVPLWDGTPRPLLAAVLGAIAALVSLPLHRRCLAVCGVVSASRPWRSAIATGVVVAVYAWLMLQFAVERIDEVRPGPVWDRLRIVHHSVLIVLLSAVTVTDWKTTFIPDFVIWLGLAIGVSLAAISGDLQMSHVWVDWNEAIPRFSGPYLPEWMKRHPHWHGLAWSVAGAVCGGVMTEAVRRISRWALGKPALGEGDSWLMAMIGAFLGWQATIIAFLLAPLLAVVVGVPVRLSTDRPYIPYGPFLALAAVVVMTGWRWIWQFETSLGTVVAQEDRRAVFSVRRLFGDPLALVGIAGVVLVALAVMLGWRRWSSGWKVTRDAR